MVKYDISKRVTMISCEKGCHTLSGKILKPKFSFLQKYIECARNSRLDSKQGKNVLIM